ncbi:MAG: hypothetical protein DRJ20_00955 [Candidatus Methanomethylicota archaeon]|uniref:SLC41A/MgtE integral membrane domain-containing protein n=1 Tax=Thermoproteota archaeon TaxID=2056631 RepID=A0A497EYB2_9CREN|nr:MAG: hypothetical protein DRJ20_00955 [Candidatus Verstraetearchaeota archaeon]
MRLYTKRQRFWRTFTQSAIALAFSIGGMFSGRIISSFSHLFIALPWIIALYPSILTLRGDISGVLSGKLGTMIHTGQVNVSFTKNTPDFYALLRAIFMLTFIDSIGMGIFTFVVNLPAGHASARDLPYFIVAPLASCLLATMISMPITISTAFLSFKKGLDPDIIVYPVVATISDILVAACYAVTVHLTLAYYPASIIAIASPSLALFLILLYFSRHDFKLRVYASTLKEASPTILLTSFGGVIDGVILASFKYVLEARPEIIVVYPVLLNALGGFGSMVGSSTTTRLALGLIPPNLSSFKDITLDVASMQFASLMLHIVFGLSSYALCAATGIPVKLLSLISLCLLVGLLGSMAISALSFAIGVFAYKKGWDPDNFVIPLVSSVADILGTVLIVLFIDVVLKST